MNLAQQQQAWLAVLFCQSAPISFAENRGELDIKNEAQKTSFISTIDPKARGFQAYQTNGLVMADRALAGAYPVLRQLIGDDSFAAMAGALWQAHPPARGDLAQWGADLPGFVRHSAQLADDPYLADVARAEWALHGLTTAADEVLDLASLQLLITHDPSVVKLCITNTCQWFASPWPVASIWLAHQADADLAAAELELAGLLIRQQVAQTVLVWRAGLRPCLREASPDEDRFLTALAGGDPLDRALQQAPALDFNAWLPVAAQSGLLIGAALGAS